MITPVHTDVARPVFKYVGPDGPKNLIPNPDFSGGYPPTGYSLIFDTTAGRMVDNGDGTFSFESNFNSISGRNVLQWFLSSLDLEVGSRYILEYTVLQVGGSSYIAAMDISNSVGITEIDTNTASVGDTVVRLYSEFTIDDISYDAKIRIGCGTTANNTAHLIYSNPRLYKL